MSGLSDFLSNLGIGGPSKANANAQADVGNATAAYGSLTPPSLTAENPQFASATQQGPSALSGISVNPADQAAQVDQMGALSNLAANGGRNAASTADLASIQQGANANAAGQRGAILQNAAARGMSGSGASLLAQLSSSQNAQNSQSAQDLGVAGQEAGTALQAGQAAAGIGSNLQNQSYGEQANAAQAQDAISRFNAGQQTGISQYNAGMGNQAQQYNTGLQQTGYQDQYQKAGGVASSNLAGAGFNQQQANMGAQQAGNLLGGVIKLGTAGFSGGSSAAAPAAAPVPGYAWGGQVPGSAPVAGNSRLNDFVPITASPGEVVVPRSLALGGAPSDIANFVKNPPQIKPVNSSEDKEAMMSALKNISNKKRGI